MKVTYFLGPLALITTWITIICAIVANPWFNLYENALSDLGAVNLETNYIFNYGLILAGILFGTYSSSLEKITKNRISSVASGIALIAAAHLIMIAIFPSGTILHRFVSLEFFLLVAITIFFIAVAFYVDGEKGYSSLSLAIFLTGILGSTLIEWPSTALLEVYNIILITIWTIMITHYCIVKRI